MSPYHLLTRGPRAIAGCGGLASMRGSSSPPWRSHFLLAAALAASWGTRSFVCAGRDGLRISDVSCASLGDTERAHIPFCSAQEACPGLAGHCDSWGTPWGETCRARGDLGLCSVPGNNTEALFCPLCAKCGVCVLEGVQCCWGHQCCCAPSAKGTEAAPPCLTPSLSACPCCPGQHPHMPVPPEGSMGTGWCWGVGTSTPRLVLSSSHHSSVCWRRDPCASLPMCRALCWVFLNFYCFYLNRSSVNTRCGEARSVGEAGGASPKVTNITIKVGSFGQIK